MIMEDFVTDLIKELNIWKKALIEFRMNSVFTNDEYNYAFDEIKRITEILDSLGVDVSTI